MAGSTYKGLLTLSLLLLTPRPAAAGLIEASPSWRYTASAAENYLGYSLAGGLDVDMDGNPEMAVGSPYASGLVGTVLLFESTGGVLSTAPDWTLTGPGASGFGSTMLAIGDTDGDQTGELVVGAPYVSTNVGAVYLYNSTTSGPSATADWTLDGNALDYFGYSLASLGDVDGDGWSDLAVGAPQRVDATWHILGGVDVFFGSDAGPQLSSAYEPPAGAGWFGEALLGADLDGDGDRELCVGSPYAETGGAVFVYANVGTELDATPTWEIVGDGTAGNLGYAMTAGDLDNDGYVDLAVASPYWNNEVGRIDVFAGDATGVDNGRVLTSIVPTGTGGFGASLADVGDLDGDGFPELAVGEPNTYGNGHIHVFPGSPAGPDATRTESRTLGITGDNFGFQVARVGDLTGDGLPDVATSTPEVARRGPGKVVVYASGDGGGGDTGGDTGSLDTGTTRDDTAVTTDDTGVEETGEDPGEDVLPDGDSGEADEKKTECGCAATGEGAGIAALAASILLIRARRR